jgi:hypothetical protein
MTMSRWYALVGHDVVGPFETLDEWYHFHAGPDWRAAVGTSTGVDPWKVAYTELDDDRYVSTVFLGLDHRLFGDGPPLIFETMIFPDCDWCERCSTWTQAEAQHRLAVADAMVGHSRDDES